MFPSINALWVVKHQAFYLVQHLRLHLISYSHSHSSAAHSCPPKGGGGGGGGVHKNAKRFVTKKCERTPGLQEGGKCMLCCSVALLHVHSFLLRHTKCGSCRETNLTDNCSVECQRCHTAVQGDYSRNKNRREEQNVEIY